MPSMFWKADASIAVVFFNDFFTFFRLIYSYFKASTGLALTTRQACTLTVNTVNVIDKTVATTNGHTGMSIL